MKGRATRTPEGPRESLVNLNARIPRQLWRRVRLQCLHEERLMQDFIAEALREYLRARRGYGGRL
jgi:hypothetical protein